MSLTHFYQKRTVQRASSIPSSSSSSYHLFPIQESIPHCRSMSMLHRHGTNSSTNTTAASTASTEGATKQKKDNNYDNDEDHQLWWNSKLSSTNIVTLTRLPPFYVLERSSMVVQQPLQQVLERIDSFLRLKSIVSVLHYPAEAVQLDCRISGGMANFTIYLWKGDEPGAPEGADTKNNDKSKNEPIIIEIQRRAGCCILMHHIQKSLFHYIMTGKNPADATAACTGSNISPSSMMAMPRIFCGDIMVNRVICSDIRQEQEEAADEELCLDNMEICEDLLQSDLAGHKRMAFESLVLMTNPFVSSEKLARAFARALIYDGGNDVVDLDMILLPSSSVNVLRDEIINHLEHNEQPTAIQVKVRESISNNDDIEELEYEQGHDFGILHNLALHILVNALEVVVSSQNQDNNNVGTMHIDLASDFWYTITKALVYNLSVAVHRPDEASMSARCLSLLQDIVPISSHDLLTMLRMHDQCLTKRLFRAQEYGRAHHLRLEQELRHLLRRLSTAQS